MSLQALYAFHAFQIHAFLEGKRVVFVKAVPWREEEKVLGSKVVVQIVEDRTVYPKPETTNFGEQLTVKVRNVTPEAFAKLKPLATEVYIKDVERSTVYGEHRNQLSIIGTIAVREAPATK